MNNTLLVSIIIPNYNSEKFIFETLDSIKNQSYKNWECIIVDDHSLDNSFNIISNYVKNDSRFKILKRPSNLPKGGNICRNYGYTKSRGNLVNWFDSDDVMLPDFLKLKVHEFEKLNNLDFVVCGGYFSDEKLQSRKQMTIFETKNIYEDYFLWNLKIITNSILFKKEYLNKYKLFSEKITKGQEFEFFTRLFSLNPNYKIITKHLFLYRSHKSSITSSNQDYLKSHKMSEAKALSDNFIRSKKSNYKIASSAYRLLINLYKKALANKHQENLDFIINFFDEHIHKNKKLVLIIMRLFRDYYFILNPLFPFWDRILKKVQVV